jgi:hypothetical protein
MAALMPLLVDSSTPDPGVVERHPLAAEAVDRLRPFWPQLARESPESRSG